MASDLFRALTQLGDKAGARAGLVIECSGIEVATWGSADFESLAAEWSELWKRIGASEALAGDGKLESMELHRSAGGWVAVLLGDEYVLALQAKPEVPPGKLRFYAKEWAIEHREDFL